MSSSCPMSFSSIVTLACRASSAMMLNVAVAAAALAGTYNPHRDVGDVVPAWERLPGVDGREHAWQDVVACDLVVVVFTCTTCPYAIDYEPRIAALAERYAQAAAPGRRVAVIAINSNAIAEDDLPAMKARAAERGYRYPYLRDAGQEVARSFGAVRTPEFFLLDRERRILYMGGMDDSADAARVRATPLVDAIEAALAGRAPPVTETPPVGCLIRGGRRVSPRDR